MSGWAKTNFPAAPLAHHDRLKTVSSRILGHKTRGHKCSSSMGSPREDNAGRFHAHSVDRQATFPHSVHRARRSRSACDNLRPWPRTNPHV